MLLEAPQSGVEGEDLYPADETEQRRLVSRLETAYQLAKDAKSGYETNWDKYYKMYRSYVKKRPRGEWRSRVWMPVAFFVIETITPRLVAQLPDPVVKPVGEEDAPGAELMEELLLWSSDKSDLWLELVKALKSALIYGTGILKTSYSEQTQYQITSESVMEEQTVDIPTGEADIDGNPITTTVSLGAQPTGEKTKVRRPYTSYAGPAAEAVDIKNFFVDPVADSIENARFVVHRVYRDRVHLEKMFEQGVYRRPPEAAWQQFLTQSAAIERQSLVGLGPGGMNANDENSLYSILEFWTPSALYAVAGDDASYGVLLRAERNPYGHGEIPFCRIVDHLVPHEFWGIGELEPLEGLQDILNKLWNTRIDNVALVLNTMFMASMEYILDPSDLQVGPGRVIRVKDGMPLDNAVKPLSLGDVTSSSYTEAQEVERMTEKTSGVSQYTGGQDSFSSYNRTATGVALISEQGNTRFAHKIKMAEVTGFRRLFRQFGSIIQQYSPPEIVVRLMGSEGGFLFQNIPADAIGGRFDYDIEGESSLQTESIRREQTLSLFQMLAADPYIRPLKLRADVLKVFGRKNVGEYLLTEQELQALFAQQAETEAAASPEGGA